MALGATATALARYALRQRYTDGVIDELLDRERVTYEDLVAASAAEGAAPPSVLKPLLRGATSEAQLASWLADVDLDASIVEKEATSELAKLVTARLGFELPGSDLQKWRAITVSFRSRYRVPRRSRRRPASAARVPRRGELGR